jgi:hypothetical protein
MATDFDDIFKAIGKPTQQEPSSAKPDPWAELAPEEREATIRLNVDIPIALNDALADKARELRTSKSELVRKLLEWALK